MESGPGARLFETESGCVLQVNIFLVLAYLFFIGSLVGWGIEVIFRRFFSSANPERKWINPGFLVGPCIPLYGFGLCVLFLLASLEAYLPIDNDVWRKLVLFVGMALCVTAVEYAAGLLSVKVMKVKLWDYSTQWGNIQGIICPKFSLAWALLSAVYYFFIHPYILDGLRWLSENLAFSFCIGFYFGILVIDVAYSAQLLVKIRRFAEEKEIVVKFEELKSHIRAVSEKNKARARFLFAMRSPAALPEHLRQYYDSHRERFEQLAALHRKAEAHRARKKAGKH